MKIASINEAKAKLSELVKAAIEGEEVVICRAGKPVVRLVPISRTMSQRRLGQWKGKIWMALTGIHQRSTKRSAGCSRKAIRRREAVAWPHCRRSPE